MVASKGASTSPRPQQEPRRLPPKQQFGEIAKIAGFQHWAAMRGLPASETAACLSNQAEVDKLVQMQNDAVSAYDIPGTPAFLLNGEMVKNSATWQALEPDIKKTPRRAMIRRIRLAARWPPSLCLPLAARHSCSRGRGRLEQDRRRHARRRLPHGQSQCAGEAGRIWLDDLPALPPLSPKRGKPLIDNYVKSGKVSFEFRNFVLESLDISRHPDRPLRRRAAASSRSRPLYATQNDWIGKINALSRADQGAHQALSDSDRAEAAWSQAGGIAQLAARHGIAPAAVVEMPASPTRRRSSLSACAMPAASL